MNFLNSVPGQKKALQILSEVYNSNRIPNAFLFVGKSGVGKFLTAIKFAKLINSDSGETKGKQIEQLKEPIIKYVFPLPRGKSELGEDGPYDKLTEEQMGEIRGELDAKIANPYHSINIEKAEKIKITSIRNIKKFLSVNYDEIKYRIVIIDNAHSMSVEAQNALLKSLEEPPRNLLFILITSHEDLLLSTIRSRCWLLNFLPLDEVNVKNLLVKHFHTEKKQAEKVAAFAGGSLTEGAAISETNFEEILDNVIKILRYSLARKYFTALDITNSIVAEYGEELYVRTLKMMFIWLSDVLKNKHNQSDYYFAEYKETLEKFNKRFIDADIQKVSSKIDWLITLMDKKVSLNLIILNTIFGLGTLGLRKR